MKILIVSDCHLPIPAVQGGAVPSLMDSIIFENEKQKRLDITVLSVYNEKAEHKSRCLKRTNFIYIKHNTLEQKIDSVVQLFVEKVFVSRKGRKIDALWKHRVLRNLKDILTKEEFDAVIIENQGYLTKAFDKQLLFDRYQKKIYYHLHNDLPDSVNYKVGQTCRYILISRYLSKRVYEKFGSDVDNNIFILKNGIPVQNYLKVLDKMERVKLRERFGFLESDRVICFVGRICVEKGILELLQAFEKIKDPEVKLLVIGSTEFGNNTTSDFELKIQNICNRLGSRVKSTGYITHEMVWKYYQAADLAVLPSVWEEPAGLTVLEAMASCLPVITTNAGGIPEYIGTEYGIILERGDDLPDKIVEAVYKVLSDYDNWKKKAKLAGEYVADNYSEECYYNEFLQIISNESMQSGGIEYDNNL